jgi:hypothetical protein
MRPQEALESVVRAIDQSQAFDPNDIITDEFDPEGRNNRLQTPFVVVLPVGTTRDTNMNTDLVGFVTDQTGERTSEVYESVFEMDIQIDIYLAAGDDRQVTTLGGALRRALFTHDSAGIDESFPDDGSGVVGDIRDFDVGTGQRADDLSGPGIRRWRHESAMRFVSRVTPGNSQAVQEFEQIVTPSDDDLQPFDPDAVDFEYEVS